MKLGKLVLFGGVAALVGCVPPPTGGGTPSTSAPVVTTTAAPGVPHTPQIASFTASKSSAPSPLTTALRWSISDPEGNPMTCALDLDGNGSFETNVGPCSSATSRTRTFTSSVTVGLQVSDGTNVATATVPLTVGAASSDQFGITLRTIGSMTTNQSNAFAAAAAKWQGIIKTGVPDTALNLAAGACLSGAAAFNGTIDDVMIDTQVTNIDGSGGILGQAGPCYYRSASGISLYGIMQFDSADMANLEANGTLVDTIVHEMGHVLGVGTMWDNMAVPGAPLITGAGGSDPRFVGPAATGVWREFGGVGDVPVENSGGGGTRDSHWRETTFRTELMTGWLNSSNQLSRLSAASMADMGYGVDLAGADAYTLPTLMAMWRVAAAHEDHEHDEHDEHMHTEPVTPLGGV